MRTHRVVAMSCEECPVDDQPSRHRRGLLQWRLTGNVQSIRGVGVPDVTVTLQRYVTTIDDEFGSGRQAVHLETDVDSDARLNRKGKISCPLLLEFKT